MNTEQCWKQQARRWLKTNHLLFPAEDIDAPNRKANTELVNSLAAKLQKAHSDGISSGFDMGTEKW